MVCVNDTLGHQVSEVRRGLDTSTRRRSDRFYDTGTECLRAAFGAFASHSHRCSAGFRGQTTFESFRCTRMHGDARLGTGMRGCPTVFPITAAGRIAAAALMLLGIGFVAFISARSWRPILFRCLGCSPNPRSLEPPPRLHPSGSHRELPPRECN